MTSVTVGVHVYADPERLRVTLESLAVCTAPRVAVLPLPDEPAPACFNRLARATDSDVIVFLESGAVVGPAWLDRLLDALAADPRHGLAGPSTNRAWNEQRVLPRACGTAAEVMQSATNISRRFGATWRTLEPLHSLADFCYAVRREVLAAVGEADEQYGLGPCWEMDYNIRAARAGFRGVWACGSYVYRSPATHRRCHEEARLFERNKRRYQDKFCGLRLRRERDTYETHCRGEECEHFAPAGLIEITRHRVPVHEQPRPVPRVEATDSPPLVSCIMPTRNRREFVLQSVAYFQRQTLTRAELLILDDGSADLSADLPHDDRIRYIRTARGESIGTKRNCGVQMARGRFIAHWDDDDLYAATRLERQVAPLIAGAADITGLTTGVFFVLPAWKFWRVTPAAHRRLFVHDVHGGTLVYDRRLWDQGARYPSRSIAEDAHLLSQAVRRGGRLMPIAGDDLFIYVRHGANAWRFDCGRYLDPRGWLTVDEPALLAADRGFYLAMRGRSPRPEGAVGGSPLVSCVMPTADRRRFVARAIEYFQRQDYPAVELLVLDDGDDPVRDIVPPDPRVRYERLSPRRVLGTKRNLACEMSRGDVIVHWDDDDWMASNRVSRQVAALLEAPQVEVCGLSDLMFYAPATKDAWRYQYLHGRRPWAAGNTLCYWKRAWARHPFPAVREGEDTQFVWTLGSSMLRTLQDGSFFVGIVHARNTSRKRVDSSGWSPSSPTSLRALLGSDVAFYDALSDEAAIPEAAGR
jgi:glycosyltransferase involved in cell wall biosynthesis